MSDTPDTTGTGRIVVLADRTDPRLGRHQVHDPRSRAFALEPVALPTRPVMHTRHIPIFNQKSVGCCTATAALGMLSTGPTSIGKQFSIDDAHSFYHDETIIDEADIPGVWPPTDTGSAGIYACKVALSRGWIKSYQHAFDLPTTLGWIGRQPVCIGIPWLQSMFRPGRGGLLNVDRNSPVAGGHELCADGIYPARSMVRIANSWGTSWGDRGWCWLRYEDLGWLLDQGGDAVTVTL